MILTLAGVELGIGVGGRVSARRERNHRVEGMLPAHGVPRVDGRDNGGLVGLVDANQAPARELVTAHATKDSHT